MYFQGKLEYDAPIAEVWPEFGQAGKTHITLQQLMTHQSSLFFLEGPQVTLDEMTNYDEFATRLAAVAPQVASSVMLGHGTAPSRYQLDACEHDYAA